jgi:predicted unusual protein kinase regulating ubiquinone biosynthesis (AarF/ABC1/UbiB family)
MWRLGFRIMQPMSVLTADRAKIFWNVHKVKYTLVPVACTSIYYLFHHNSFSALETDNDNFENLYDEVKRSTVIETAKYIIRFLELGIIFTPTVLCLPLYLFDTTRDFWINIFLNAIKRAGIVWIKSFQYLSHRRDVIGADVAAKFEVLRENAPQHGFEATVETIQRVYGKSVWDMFEDFNPVPIASGSVSNIYKAKLHGKTVAVKVRHPDVGKNLCRDIDLMFKISRFLSHFSKFFEIPITEDSLKKILSEQLLFLK